MAKPFYPQVKPGGYVSNVRQKIVPFVGRGGWTSRGAVFPPFPPNPTSDVVDVGQVDYMILQS